MTVLKTSAPENINVSMFRPHLRDVPNFPSLPHGYSLSLLEHGDEPQLTALLASAFEEAWDETRVQDTLTRAPDVRAVYGAFQRGKLVATASSQFRPERDRNAGFVHWLATHPHHRGQGLAATLLERLLPDFKQRGYTSARLFTQPERLPAIKMYLGFGFVPEYEVDGGDHRAIWSSIFQVLAARR